MTNKPDLRSDGLARPEVPGGQAKPGAGEARVVNSQPVGCLAGRTEARADTRGDRPCGNIGGKIFERIPAGTGPNQALHFDKSDQLFLVAAQLYATEIYACRQIGAIEGLTMKAGGEALLK